MIFYSVDAGKGRKGGKEKKREECLRMLSPCSLDLNGLRQGEYRAGFISQRPMKEK